MTEGKKHHQAAERLAKLLMSRGFKVEFDRIWKVNDNDRVTGYFPDITATLTLTFEINGNVGHSSKRSFENELNQKAFIEKQGAKFFAYSPGELVGKGWTDSKGNKHNVHKDSELYEDWGL